MTDEHLAEFLALLLEYKQDNVDERQIVDFIERCLKKESEL